MSTTLQPHSRSPSRLLIQMSGAPGSGKSTMAKLLQKSLRAIVIDHDIYRSALLEDDHGTFDHVAKSAYRIQWTMAQELMKQGFNFIVDSTCNFQEVLDQGRQLADQYGFIYWYVECRVQDIHVLDERLRKRDPMKSQRTGVDCPPAAASSSRAGEDSRVLFKKWMENPCRPECNALVVDTTEDAEKNRDYVLHKIASDLSVCELES